MTHFYVLTFLKFFFNVFLNLHDREYAQRKKTALTWSCNTDGPPVHTTACNLLGGSAVQERARVAKVTARNDLERGRGIDRQGWLIKV